MISEKSKNKSSALLKRKKELEPVKTKKALLLEEKEQKELAYLLEFREIAPLYARKMIRYWNSCEYFYKLQLRKSKRMLNVLNLLKKLKAGTLFKDLPACDFEQFKIYVDSFVRVCSDPGLPPVNKTYIRKAALDDFLYNPYAGITGGRSFLKEYCLNPVFAKETKLKKKRHSIQGLVQMYEERYGKELPEKKALYIMAVLQTFQEEHTGVATDIHQLFREMMQACEQYWRRFPIKDYVPPAILSSKLGAIFLLRMYEEEALFSVEKRVIPDPSDVAYCDSLPPLRLGKSLDDIPPSTSTLKRF